MPDPIIESVGKTASIPWRKKDSSLKIVFALVGLAILLGGLGAGIILVRQRQEIRNKAMVGGAGKSDSCNLISVTSTESPSCPRLESVQNCSIVPTNSSQKNSVSTYTNIFQIKNTDPQNRSHKVKYLTSSFWCSQPYGNLSACNWPLPSCGENGLYDSKEVTLEPGEARDIPVARNADAGMACGSFQLDFQITSVDENTNCYMKFGTPTDMRWGWCETGTECSAQVAGQCLNIKAFDTNWNQLSADELAHLQAGSVVRFTVAGQATSGSFDKARFSVNGITRPEVTQTRPSSNPTEFYDEYILPAGVTSFAVNAQIHHSSLGWF